MSLRSRRLIYFREEPLEEYEVLLPPSPSSNPYWFAVVKTEQSVGKESFPVYRKDDSLVVAEPNSIFVEAPGELQAQIESYLAITHPTSILSHRNNRIWMVAYVRLSEPTELLKTIEDLRQAYPEIRARVCLRFEGE